MFVAATSAVLSGVVRSSHTLNSVVFRPVDFFVGARLLLDGCQVCRRSLLAWVHWCTGRVVHWVGVTVAGA